MADNNKKPTPAELQAAEKTLPVAEQAAVAQQDTIESPWQSAMRRLRKNKLALLGLIILVALVLFSFVGPFFSPYKLHDSNLMNKKLAPNSQHLLGTDANGRDVLLRLMLGGQISLLVGIIVVVIEVFIGTLIGGLSGFYGGWVDGVLMRITDVFMSVPTMPILILLGAILTDLKVDSETRIFYVMVIIGVLSWPGLARLVRGQILSLREQEFMQATEALGIRDSKKIIRHLIPNVIPTIIVYATLGIGSAILVESTLSFLGLGVAPPYPSWGNMIQAARGPIDLQSRPWLWIPPGITIFLSVIAINLFGDGLRDALDPKLKR